MNAIITGILGQDASYLAQMLIGLGHNVYGVYRRVSTGNNLGNIESFKNNENLKLISGDICDESFVNDIISSYKPDLYFNLAAQSHVGYSFSQPLATFDVDAKAVLIALEAIRKFSPHTRFYQASTSELFGGLNCPTDGFSEASPFYPRSPYAVAKLAAFWAVVNYREAYKLHACNGILFNHSSPRRSLDFATRKITHGIAKVRLDLASTLSMGDLTPFRDEGHSEDYMDAAYRMLTANTPRDYVIATGSGATISDMFKYVCELAQLDFDKIYKQDDRFMRPSEVQYLLGNSAAAQRDLKWTPKYTWKQLLKEMYEHDVAILTR